MALGEQLVPDELSLWELAHRWHGLSASSDDCPSFKVRDTLRWLADAIDQQQLVAVDYRRESTCGEGAWEHLPFFLGEIRAGQFDRTLLDGVFVLRRNLEQFCLDEGVPLPPIWGGGEQQDEPKRRVDAAEDRVRCRVIAEILWHEDPGMTVAAIARHPWTQKIGNAAQYKGGEKTVRNWISDLNPKPVTQRRGRPRKERK